MAGLAPTTSFVGREPEKALALRALEGAKRGRGTVLLVSGPTGAGKTRFADLVADRADGLGFQVLRQSAVEGDATPYAPFHRILQQGNPVHGHTRGHSRSPAPVHSGELPSGDLPSDEAQLPLTAAVGEGGARRGGPPPGTAGTGGSPWGGVPLGELLSTGESRELGLGELPPLGAAVRVLEQLGQRYGGKPLLISLENFQWADAGSFALLRSLAREARRRPLVLMVVFETGEAASGEDPAEGPNVEGLAKAVQRESGAVRITLRGLSDAEVKELAEEVLHAPLLLESDGRLPAMLERTGGNPFFVQEIVKAGVRDGWIAKRGDGFRVLEPSHDLQVPTLLRWWVHRRINALSPDDLTLLEAISVLGTEFDPRTLPSMLPEQAAGIRRGLERLDTRHGLAHQVRPSVWRVEPAFLPSVIRAEMSGEVKRRLHQRAGEWQAAHDPTAVERIAGHYYQARDTQLGSLWLDRAWRAATERGDNEAAVRFARWGLDLERHPDHPDRESRWRRREAAALLQLGEIPRARELLQHALEQAPAGLPRMELLLELASTTSHQGRLEEARELLRQARGETVPPADELEAATRMASVAVNLHARFEEWNEVVRVADTFLRREDVTDELARCRALTTEAFAYTMQRKFPQARELLLEALSISRRSGFVTAEANVRTALAAVATQVGELPVARAMFEQLSQEWGRRGGVTNQAINAANAAEVMLAQGDTEAAMQWLRDAFELADLAGLAFVRLSFAPLQARLLLDVGNPKGAAELLERVLQDVNQGERSDTLRASHAIRAQALLAEGRLPEAEREASVAGHDLAGAPGPLCVLTYAKVQAALGHQDVAESILRHHYEQTETWGLRFEQALGLEALGDLYLGRKRYSEARARWDEALGLLRACGALPRAARLEDRRRALPPRY